MNKTLKTYFLACSMSLCFCIASNTASFAQNIGIEPAQIEKRFKQTVEPKSRPSTPFGLESTVAPEIASQIHIRISSVTLTNSTVYSDDDIQDLVRPLLGRPVSLAQVFSTAAQITAKYGNDGFLLSRVVVPPQALEPSGVHLVLQAVEGFASKVIWTDEFAKGNRFVSEYSENIETQNPLSSKTLERNLLLASDLPGPGFQSTIVPSPTDPQASELLITAQEKTKPTVLSVDNYGSRASGKLQASLQTEINDFRRSQSLSFGYVTAGPRENSAKPELHFAFFRYRKTLNSDGLVFQLDGNGSLGQPGTATLRAINLETQSLNVSPSISYPFIRSRSKNLTGTLALDFKNSKTTILGATTSEDRQRILRGELSYDFADRRGGINQFVGSVSFGIDGLGSAASTNQLASRSNAPTDFVKASLGFSRSQRLANNFSLHSRIFGQWSNTPLLSSQECGYGGQNFGRGFDSSTLVGDKCLLASLELQKNINETKFFDTLQFYGALDLGFIENIAAPQGTPNSANASSVGLGIRLGKNNWSTDLLIAVPVHKSTSLANSDPFKILVKFQARF